MPDGGACHSLGTKRLKSEEVDAADPLHWIEEAQDDLRRIDTDGASLDNAAEPAALVRDLLERLEVLTLEDQNVLEHEDGDEPVCGLADHSACRRHLTSVTNLQVARQVVSMDLAGVRL